MVGWESLLKLFKPVINFMDNLSDDQRFSFIGMILGIPIIILTLFFISELNQEIQWTEERLTGVQYSKLLKDLLQDVQQHRGLMIGYINNELDFEHRLKEKQIDIDEDLERIKQYDIEEGNSLNAIEIAELVQLRNEINNFVRHPQQMIEFQNECAHSI